MTYRHNLAIPGTGMTGWLQWRVHPYETDGNGGQASLIYVFRLNKEVYVSGWLDLNVIEGGDNRWVFGPYFNYRVHERVSAMLRFRYNGYEHAAPTLDGTGWAIGTKIDF